MPKTTKGMKTADYQYSLPPELIAQRPLAERSASRMLALHCASGRIEHRGVADLPGFLREGDVVVANNTRVLPARLFGRRLDTGGLIELLLLEPSDPSLEEFAPDGPDSGSEQAAQRSRTWEALYKGRGKARPGLRLALAGDRVQAKIVAARPGRVRVHLHGDEPVESLLQACGHVPLPPYIKRPKNSDGEMDRDRYQTMFASRPGAVAAPTAGLHFTPDLVSALAGKGVNVASVTLHVGAGTFTPVKTEFTDEHVMEEERFEIGAETAGAVNSARERGGRVVAIGSTTLRALETGAAPDGTVSPVYGRSSLFIRPPHRFKAVDALLTNFHLPCSTLLMMVSAFCGFLADPAGEYRDESGRGRTLNAYAEAIRHRYRMYSYGDCMLLH